MVVNQFDFVGHAVSPNEHKSPLAINADAMLSFSITAQGLQVIGWRHTKIIEDGGGGNNGKLPSKRRFDGTRNTTPAVFQPESLKPTVVETANHAIPSLYLHYTA
jgi:hypothetical protein